MNILLQPIEDFIEPLEFRGGVLNIGRNEAEFRKYDREIIRTLSRQHAQLHSKNGELYLEDLNSLNGTFLNGELVKNKKVSVYAGDVIRFGTTITFRVSIDDESTCYISRPEEFIKRLQATQNNSEKNRKPKTKNIQKIAENKRIIIITLLALFLLILSGDALFKRGDVQELEFLIKHEEYTEAFEFAKNAIEGGNNESLLRSLGAQAYHNVILPKWIAYFRESSFSEARKLTREIPPSTYIPITTHTVLLLDRIIDFKEFLANKRLTGNHVELFRDEEKIELILEQWSADEQRDRDHLNYISGKMPSFSPVLKTVLSELRSTQSWIDLYLPAIKHFKKRMALAIDKGNFESFYEYADDFALKYPKISGVQEVKHDIRQLERLLLAGKEQNLDTIVKVSAEPPSRVPKVIKLFSESLKIQIPESDTLTLYRNSKQAWALGDHDVAIAYLESSSSEKWALQIDLLRDRFSKLTKETKRLITLDYRQTKDQIALLSFLKKLNPIEDAHLYSQLRNVSLEQKKNLLLQAQKYKQEAISHWRKYIKVGGISGKHRLQSTVTSTYRSQAKYLSLSYENITNFEGLYDLLDSHMKHSDVETIGNIQREYNRQIKALNDLRQILPGHVVSEKLSLFSSHINGATK